MSTSFLGQISPLLWAAAALVAFLAASLFQGWVRRASGIQGSRALVGPLLCACGALGAGMAASMPLAMSSGSLAFPLGFRWLVLPALFLGPVLALLPAAWWLTQRQGWLSFAPCGMWLALVALALQAGWIAAAGLRPGPHWQWAPLALTTGLCAVGFTASLRLAYVEGAPNSEFRTLWRLMAAALMAMTLLVGQEVMISSTGLAKQLGSVHQREVSATWLSLLAGVLVPTVLAVMLLNLTLLNVADRQRRRDAGVSLSMPRRRKHKRKFRAL